MKKSLTMLAATATALVSSVAGALPAHAAVPSCTHPQIATVQVTPHPLGIRYDYIDGATATASCVDVAGVTHTSQLVLEWWYWTGSGYSPMPACPNQVASPSVTWVGAVALSGTAACHRPPESLAYEVSRYVCVDLIVDGTSYWGTPQPGDLDCREVLLNPTPLG